MRLRKMVHRGFPGLAILGLAFLLAFLPGRAAALSSSTWEFQQPQNATESAGVAAVQNKNEFVLLSVGWNQRDREYIISLHSQNLIDRSRDIRFSIDGRDSIRFKGSRDWTEREYSIHNNGKSAVIGSPYSRDTESLKQRKRNLIELLQSGRRAVIRYEEIVYGPRRVRFTLNNSRKTISRLTSGEKD